MRILIAPNAFKNSLNATEVAEAIGAGLQQSRLACDCRYFPVGDGGDGTAELLIRHFRGRKVTVEVQDPLGKPRVAELGLIHEGRTAVIEIADASGLRLLRPDELDPLHASSFGTGQMIRSALDHGVRAILLGVGGSATVDGGTGLLRALGMRFLSATGAPLMNLPEELANVHAIDMSGLDPRLKSCAVTILCDVDNPLLSVRGAARIFGPQKGAAPAAIEMLEAGLQRWGEVLHRQTGRDVSTVAGGGAAGGIAAGLLGILDARLVSGIDYFLDCTDFDAALSAVDLVVTGEGSIDEQTPQGKAPYGVAIRAKAHNIPVVAFAGQVPMEPSTSLRSAFDVLLAIGSSPLPVAEAIQYTAHNLRRTALDFGNALALGRQHSKQGIPS